ncbi:MAG: AI-2E family transporter [bacterium]|nr:AI-2E family transporter [bacterium]
MSEQTLDISIKTIIKIFIAVFVLYVIYLAKDVVLWFFFALIISVLLEPAINFLRWFRLPKIIAMTIIYLSVFGFLGGLIYITAPIFIFELKQFSQYLPDYFENIDPILKQFGIDLAYIFSDLTKVLTNGLEKSSGGIISAVATFFGGVSSAIFILALAFFLSLEEKGTEKVLVLLAPKKYEEYIIALFERSQVKVSGWFAARILSCFFVGVASFIIFYIFNVKYAFILALISGVLNFVPYIGPLITIILLIVFVAVSSNSWIAVSYVLISVAAIQIIENNLLTPVLMKKMINLPPVLVLISLLVGSQMLGFLGTIFAVPVFAIVYEFLKEFLEKRREEESQLE